MKKADTFNPGKWLVENKITTQSRINEDMSTEYWADYNVDTSGQVNPKFAIKSDEFEKTFEYAVSEWNREADGEENKISGNELDRVKKVAEEFFSKAGWLSVNVAHAMISHGEEIWYP